MTMKKLFRTLLCGALLVASLSISAFAAEDVLLISPAPTTTAPAAAQLPELQGDFYVLVNGEYVTFTDAVPKIKNDRSCLPFVAVFEQLGFAESDMTWDHDTKTVTATKGDLTVSLTIGRNEIIIIKGGETTVVPTDVAPYIEPALSRTYIPFGLVADALHYAVGWDADVRAVIIDDVDAIMAENAETYELMDKYLAYASSLNTGKNQKVSGNYSATFELTEVVENQLLDMEFLADGDYSMIISKDYAMEFDTEMDFGMQAYLDGANITKDLKDAGELPELPDAIDFAMRGDLMNGKFYFQSAALCELMEQPDMANAWFMMDMAALTAGSGMDYSELMAAADQSAKDMTFEELLIDTLKNTTLTSVEATTADTLALVNALFGDSAFVKDGRDYVNYIYLDDIDGLGTAAELEVTFYTSGSKVNGCGIYMAMEDVTTLVEMEVTMKGTEMKMEMVMDMVTSESSAVTLFLDMDGSYTTTSKTPNTQPPAGAVILDLMAQPEI